MVTSPRAKFDSCISQIHSNPKCDDRIAERSKTRTTLLHSLSHQR